MLLLSEPVAVDKGVVLAQGRRAPNNIYLWDSPGTVPLDPNRIFDPNTGRHVNSRSELTKPKKRKAKRDAAHTITAHTTTSDKPNEPIAPNAKECYLFCKNVTACVCGWGCDHGCNYVSYTYEADTEQGEKMIDDYHCNFLLPVVNPKSSKNIHFVLLHRMALHRGSAAMERLAKAHGWTIVGKGWREAVRKCECCNIAKIHSLEHSSENRHDRDWAPGQCLVMDTQFYVVKSHDGKKYKFTVKCVACSYTRDFYLRKNTTRTFQITKKVHYTFFAT